MIDLEQISERPLVGIGRMRDTEFPYRIGDLAREFDVTLRTLRFYEDKGLLHPERQGTTRLYSELDRAKLKLILMGKKVGFSLNEIRQLLSLYDFEKADYIDLNSVKEMFLSQLDLLQQQKKTIEASLVELEDELSEVESKLHKAVRSVS